LVIAKALRHQLDNIHFAVFESSCEQHDCPPLSFLAFWKRRNFLEENYLKGQKAFTEN
jgi:hypothetical protein